MSGYVSLLQGHAVPQSRPLDARQVQNSAGGYVYAVDDFARLERFLVLGSASGTYYEGAGKLTRANAACVEACYAADADRTLATIVAFSVEGRAPKVGPVLFALALGTLSGNVETRRAVYAAVPQVCRTASHLFEFVANVTGLGRGWGRALKRAVARWYLARGTDALAYQMVKYRIRQGFSHRRLLKTAHPLALADDGARRALFGQVAGQREVAVADLPPVMRAHLAAMQAEDARSLLPIVRAHDLPWEAIPTWALTDPDVQRALLPGMGHTALVRNLATLTRIGVLAPLSDELALVRARLTDADAVRQVRVHPFQILQALTVYRGGRAQKGSTAWTPVPALVAALDEAFYKAFANVVPTGKRHLVAVDVSGSMDTNVMSSGLRARDGAAALAMVTLATEPRTHTVAFSHEIVDLPISAGMRLDAVVETMRAIPMGMTDCAQPMLYALRNRIPVDVFVILTDNESWSGAIHPMEALRRYRKAMGIEAKLVAIALTATRYSVADPEDLGTLDVVGFDSAAPQIIAEFAR